MKRIIDEQVISNIVGNILLENKMRAYGFIDDLKDGVNTFMEVIQNWKRQYGPDWINIEEASYQYYDKLNVKYYILPIAFYRELTHNTETSGFFNIKNRSIFIGVSNDTNSQSLLEIMMHETEHCIDRTDDAVLRRTTFNQVGIRRTLDTLKTPFNNQALDMASRLAQRIIYMLWDDTEKNAWASSYINNNEMFYKTLNMLGLSIKQLGMIPSTYTDFWNRMMELVIPTKIATKLPDDDLKMAEMIKKHFITKSKDKLKKFYKVQMKKIMYANMKQREKQNKQKYNQYEYVG